MSTFRVFIGNIPYSLTDDALSKEAAALKLTPTAVSVAKRQTDNKPMGFGFLTFATQDEANKAISALNKKTIGERVVRAESAYTEEVSAARKKFVLHVGNLPEVATSDDVANIFDGFKLVRHEVIVDRNGKSKGFGYVGFESTEEMERAIRTCKGTTVEGREITLEAARPIRRRKGRFPRTGGAPGSAAPTEGRPEGRTEGRTEGRSERPRRPRREPRPAAAANATTGSTAPTGSSAPRTARPRVARTARPRVPDNERVKAENVVHIGNLAFKAETGDVQKSFEKYKPTKVNVLRRRDGRSKGFAFVEFATATDAQKALEMNEVDLMGRKITCNIAFKQILPEQVPAEAK